MRTVWLVDSISDWLFGTLTSRPREFPCPGPGHTDADRMRAAYELNTCALWSWRRCSPGRR
jgi:hypothetical protein